MDTSKNVNNSDVPRFVDKKIDKNAKPLNLDTLKMQNDAQEAHFSAIGAPPQTPRFIAFVSREDVGIPAFYR